MDYARSRNIFERAEQVIPGGIYGHVSPAAVLPGRSPYFAARGEGPYYWDADGNRYIDFVCGYGPMVLGYHHPGVEAAAAEQRSQGAVFNHPTETSIQLAEKLVSLIDFADWAVFARNGSDVTTWATMVAREHTQKRKIIKVGDAYHGVDPWCTPGTGGLIEEDRSQIVNIRWNDLESVQKAFAENQNDIAAVILTPYHHPVFAHQVFGESAFFQGIRTLCDAENALLILDDIRAGFRTSINGSHSVFGIQPDMACYCKALANGYPISAAVGTSALKEAASRVFLTGSYWNDAVAHAACLACLQILEKAGVPEHLDRIGTLWTGELSRLASDCGISLKTSGPMAAPYVSVDDDPNLTHTQSLFGELINAGLFMHPHHNGFMSFAHTDSVIDEALEIASAVFKNYTP